MKWQPAVWSYLQENAELFRADTTSQSWKDYVNYVDNMVLDEYDHFIHKSLNYFIDNMVLDVSYKYKILIDLCYKNGVIRSPLESIVYSSLMKDQAILLQINSR